MRLVVGAGVVKFGVVDDGRVEVVLKKWMVVAFVGKCVGGLVDEVLVIVDVEKVEVDG